METSRRNVVIPQYNDRLVERRANTRVGTRASEKQASIEAAKRPLRSPLQSCQVVIFAENFCAAFLGMLVRCLTCLSQHLIRPHIIFSMLNQTEMLNAARELMSSCCTLFASSSHVKSRVKVQARPSETLVRKINRRSALTWWAAARAQHTF